MNRNLVLGSVPLGSEAFAIAEDFINIDKSILYIACDDREIFNIKSKLKWLLPKTEILIYRSWDQIPYDNVSPSKEIQSERIKTLYNLSDNNKKLIITSVNAIIQKTINKEFLNTNFIEIFINQKIDFNNLIFKLLSLGYERTSVVRDKTEFAIRGSIIDIFIVDHEHPIRIDFFDNKIESIYSFNHITQKRLNKLNNKKIIIYSSSELLLNEESIKLFRKNFREIFSNYRLSHIYHSFSEGIIPPGGEQFIPVFLNNMESIFTYLKNTQIILTNEFYNLLEVRIENIDDFFNARKNLNENFFLEPSNLYLSKKEIFSYLKKNDLIELQEFKNEKSNDSKIKKIPNLSSIRKEIDFNFIKKFLDIYKKSKKIIICCRSLGSLQRVDKIILNNLNIKFDYVKNINEISKMLIFLLLF